MKVGLLSYGFVNWGGGIDLIRYILNAMLSVASENNVSITLILPRDDILMRFKRAAYPIHAAIRSLINGGLPRFKKHPGFSAAYLKGTFDEYQGQITIVFCGSDYHSQLKMARKINLDVVMPCIDPPGLDFELPWVGYIYDFQHIHMPKLFSESEIARRNRKFELMLNRAKHVIVNANSVASDARKAYPDHSAKVHVLPFSPCPQLEWMNGDRDVRENYNIEAPYFMVCNQFWRHKDHETAFRAMARYVSHGGKCIMVCTGSVADYLSAGHYDELVKLISELNLSKQIKILGHVPKSDQIALMKKTQAVLQPTLFEGGPGGGASYDAISLGIPVIASDIPVNLEINCGNVVYFRAGSAEDLAQKMIDHEILEGNKLSPELLWDQGLARRRVCGEVLIDLINEVVTENKIHGLQS